MMSVVDTTPTMREASSTATHETRFWLMTRHMSAAVVSSETAITPWCMTSLTFLSSVARMSPHPPPTMTSQL